MSIDVLLINPPFRLEPPFKYKLIDPPRNLALLAAVLRENGNTVSIVDMPIFEMCFEDIIPIIKSEKPKIIGISNRSTYSFPIVCKLAKLIKEMDNSIPIVVGGTYVSFAPEDALNSCENIDYIIIGEGETPMRLLVNAIINNTEVLNVPNIAYRDNNKQPILSPKVAPIEDLGTIPLPAIDLLPIDLYVERGERYILDISRGCLNACPYCTSSFIKKSVRYRPKEHIMKEILTAYQKGFRSFYFFDDIFTANKELVQAVCQGIVENNLSIKWPCMSRIDAIDEITLMWMKKAGCDLIAYGIETISPKALQETGKSDQIDKISTTFSLTRAHGIRALSFVIFGMPHNSFIDDLNTIRFLSRIKPDAVGAFSFKPYPGTIYYNEPEKFGLNIFDKNFSKWSQLDEPTHENLRETKDEIIEAMLICNYLFRTGGQFSTGNKYRRRKGVLALKTKEGGLLYNPYLPVEKRKTDMFLNGIKVDSIYFEVLYRCDGYHNTDDLQQYIEKLFDISANESAQKVNEIIIKALEICIIEEIPDVTDGENHNRGALFNGGGLI